MNGLKERRPCAPCEQLTARQRVGESPRKDWATHTHTPTQARQVSKLAAAAALGNFGTTPTTNRSFEARRQVPLPTWLASMFALQRT
jgi:hypothetical protein